MPKTPKVCLLGQVFIDVTLSPRDRDGKLRLGGILHAARTLWALKIDYTMAYIAPAYLTHQIESYAKQHGAMQTDCIGTVTGSPNVILIAEPTEAGPQRYEFLLRDEHRTLLDKAKLRHLAKDQDITDILIFPGGFDIQEVLQSASTSDAAIHADIAYGIEDVKLLIAHKKPLATVMISTSSELFTNFFESNPTKLRKTILPDIARSLIFKENRGGSRFFSDTGTEIQVKSQTRPIVHSVGVGDSFDASFVALSHSQTTEDALAYSSHIAGDYASTTYPDDFRNGVRRTLSLNPKEVRELGGTSLPWEIRPLYPIYIAAPDFDYIDRSAINQLCQSLQYHNLVARRPVLEIGQAKETDELATKIDIFYADLKILSECRLVIAVLLSNDPGTLIEIGIATERRLPLIIYDPYNLAQNLFLQAVPDLLTDCLDEVISETFRQLSKIVNPDEY